MNIFDFKNYKHFVISWVKSQPRSGYGQYKKISDCLGISSVATSQIFKGDRDLTEEQALELSEFLGLLDSESQYFSLLVRHSRASTYRLKNQLKRQIEKAIQDSKILANRFDEELALTEYDKAIFYSTWEYSAIRLSFDIPSVRTVHEVAAKTGIELQKAKMITEFLLEKGLLKQSGEGIQMGPKVVFLNKDSPLIVSRQRAWRSRAAYEMESDNEDNFFYTCPYVASKKTLQSLRAKILKLVEESFTEVKPSQSEELFCMNIDWFKASK